MTPRERLQSWFNEHPRKTVVLSECLGALERLCPEVDFSRRRGTLLAVLEELRSVGAVTYAQSMTDWDRTGLPALPRRISLQRQAVARPSFDHVAWVPALHFAVAVTRRDLLVKLQLINRLIIENRQHLDSLIPYRERALEIFGDEKALNNAVRGDLVWGRLPLSAIGAYNPEPPLAREDCPEATGPLLVVENLHTYESLVRWNAKVQAYRSIAYGVGLAVLKVPRAVADAMARSAATGIEYFGDLDLEGVEIAAGLAHRLSELTGLSMRPANELYRQLVSQGIERRTSIPTPLAPALDGWLGPELGPIVRELFGRGRWLPQEGLSLAKLLRVGSSLAQ